MNHCFKGFRFEESRGNYLSSKVGSYFTEEEEHLLKNLSRKNLDLCRNSAFIVSLNSQGRHACGRYHFLSFFSRGKIRSFCGKARIIMSLQFKGFLR